MKIEIVDTTKPELLAGQVWRNRNNNHTYLVIRLDGKEQLLNMAHFDSRWSGSGFGGMDDEFDFVGKLRVTP